MINGIKPYPKMKDSGLPRLGQMPGHWEVRRLRTVADIRLSNVDKHAKDAEEPVRLCNYVDVYKNDRIRPDMAFMRATASAEEIERFRLQPGDVLITKDSEVWNDIGVPAVVEQAAEDLVCGYHLALLHPFRDCLAGTYLLRVLQCPRVAYQLHMQATGVTRFGLSHNAIKSTWLPLPPLREQAAIVRFLDYIDRRVRRYVRAKQKLIKLLEEQKQAVIHRAVTRGLDPDVRLRPSGVEWLGDVPEHWEVIALRRRWAVIDCKHLTVPFTEIADGFPLASVREVQSFDLSLATAKRTTREYYESLIEGGRQPRKGDLIYCRNVSVGAAAFVANDEPVAMGQDVCLIRSREENQRYLNFFLRSPSMQRQLAMLLVGSTFNRINVADINGLTVVAPPRPEQDAIAGFLDSELNVIRSAQTAAAHEIFLVREYGTRLIADVVTGKLDVREIAARLPEQPDEPWPIEEAEDMTDSSEDFEGNLDAVFEEAVA